MTTGRPIVMNNPCLILEEVTRSGMLRNAH